MWFTYIFLDFLVNHMYVNACSGINYVKKIPPIVAIYLFIYLQRGSPKYLIMWLWLINIIILNDQISCVDPFCFQLLTCQTRLFTMLWKKLWWKSLTCVWIMKFFAFSFQVCSQLFCRLLAALHFIYMQYKSRCFWKVVT